MTPYKRGDSPYYYIDLVLANGERLVRSTRETSKRRARAIEATVREFDGMGREDVRRALVEGDVTPRQLHAAKLDGRVKELLSEATDPTLSAEIDRYLRYETVPDARWAMATLREAAPDGAGLSWIDDLDHLREVVAHMRETGYKPGTEHRQMAYVSKFLRFALGSDRRDALFGELKLREVNNERCAYLSAEEMWGLEEIASGRMWALISTAAATGLRLGELMSLRVRDVDLGQGVVRVRAGKSRSSRRKVPLSGEPLETLARQMEGKGEREEIWPDLDNNKVWHRFDRYRRALGLKTEEGEWFRFHDLRHHYAVHLARQGVPLTDLRDYLGHSSLRMVERYAIYTPLRREDQYRRALREMGLEKGPDAGESQRGDQQHREQAGG